MRYSTSSVRFDPDNNHSGTAVCELLSQQIIDTIDMQLQSKAAANAVKDDPDCTLQLKSLFDGIGRDLLESIKLIIGRVDALGGVECAAIRIATQRLHRSDHLVDGMDGRAHLQALLSRYSKYDSATRRIVKSIEELGDLETQALLEAIRVSIERNLWLLETHLEAIVAGLHGRKLPEWTPAFEQHFRNIQRKQRVC
jgi:DNA-binding ferritin-like protein